MKQKSISSCNILDAASDPQKLWGFEASGNRFKLTSEAALAEGKPFPAKQVRKNWQTLLQRRVNIVWLPSEQVFVRVVQLPAADRAETRSMVSIQLEKLSPLPVNQIVWSMESLPVADQSMQSVIVLMARKETVDALTAKLDDAGYQPDSLELPCLQQLQTLESRSDGVWLYPIQERANLFCLAAWWYGGALQSLQILQLPEGADQATRLTDQLTQTAWAGEMEGWLGATRTCRLCAEAGSLENLVAPLKTWSGAEVERVVPLSGKLLAEKVVEKAAADEHRANLLPAEQVARYYQRQVDRLWMNGLVVIVAAYSIGVLIYLGALQTLKFQKNKVLSQIAQLGISYTNTIKLDEQIQVLQTQIELKYNALDCLAVVANTMPLDLTLDSLQLSQGQLTNQTLLLNGTASPGQQSQVTEFYTDLSQAKVGERKFFSKVSAPTIEQRGQTVVWRITGELTQSEF